MDQPDDIAGRIMLVVDAALPAAARETCEAAAASLAQRTGVPVTLATVPIETLDAAQPLVRRGPARIRELAPPASPDAAPMGAAPFVWREGRPDWGAMWTTFCELALYGGPPHRGPEQALRAPGPGGPAGASAPEMQAELTRDNAFPRRMGKPEEYAQLALAIVRNPMLNGSCIRLDAGVRFAPK